MYQMKGIFFRSHKSKNRQYNGQKGKGPNKTNGTQNRKLKIEQHEKIPSVPKP